MIKDTDIMLHLLTKHTNKTIPYSDYVKADTFPTQITSLLNTEATIKYRNHYKTTRLAFDMPATITRDGKKISSRPEDDTPNFGSSKGPEVYEEQDDVYEEAFTIVRADSTAPNILICISKDYAKMIVSSTEIDESGEYKFLSDVAEYAIQMREFISMAGVTQFAGSTTEKTCSIFRCDDMEPCYAIIMENYSGKIVRFILGDECYVKLDKVPDGTLTYDGIAEYRKSAMSGKVIYGTV